MKQYIFLLIFSCLFNENIFSQGEEQCYKMHINQAFKKFDQGEYYAAIEQFEAAKICIELPKDKKELIENLIQNSYECIAFYEYGNLFLATTLYEDASEMFKKIRELNPTDPIAKFKLQESNLNNYDSFFMNDGIYKVEKDGKISFANELGSLLLEFGQIQNALYFDDGFCPIQINGKWGYLNTDLEYSIRPQYTYAYLFQNSSAFVCEDINKEKCGLINDKGIKLTKFKYQDLYGVFFDKNSIKHYYLLKKGRKYGIIDELGKEITGFKYDATTGFDYDQKGIIGVKIKGKWGYINFRGQQIISSKYDKASHFSNNLAKVVVGRNTGYINNRGEIVIPFQHYKQAGDFNEGRAWICPDNKCGFINTKGTTVVNFQYNHLASYQDGFACVKKNEKYGFIDKNGDVVIDFKFDKIASFINGRAKVEQKGKVYYVNSRGDCVKNCL